MSIDYGLIVRKLPTPVENFTNFLQCRRYHCCVSKNLPPMSLVRYPKCTGWSGTCDKGENMILLQVWTNAWCAPIVGMFIDNRKCFVNILHTANEAGENVMSILVLFERVVIKKGSVICNECTTQPTPVSMTSCYIWLMMFMQFDVQFGWLLVMFELAVCRAS